MAEADMGKAATRYKPGDAKLAEIIDVARNVIMTTGFDGMTISDLAQKVGMTRSLLPLLRQQGCSGPGSSR